jgi:hypothetical protein
MEHERSLEGKRQELYRQLLSQRGNAEGTKNASAVEVADAAQKAAGALASPAPTTTSSPLESQDSAAQFLERLATQSGSAAGQSYGPAAAQFLEKLASQSTSSTTTTPTTAQFLERIAAQSAERHAAKAVGVVAPIPPAPPAKVFGLPVVKPVFGLPPAPPAAPTPPMQSSLQAALGTNAVGGSAILASINRDPRKNLVKTPLSPPESRPLSPVMLESPEKGEEGDETVAPVCFGVSIVAEE